MANKTLSSNQLRRTAEIGTRYHSWNEGRYRIALVYPNGYQQGMGNLGFQTVYHLINQRDDCLCERFFLPEASGANQLPPPLSLESDRPLRDFDLIALSISFENDYLHLPAIFAAGNIPLFAAQRQPADPLVLFGGVCAFINPEPIAEIVDLIAVGEAEPILPLLLDTLHAAMQQTSLPRNELLLALAQLPGVYVPQFYQPLYTTEGITYQRNAAVPKTIRRQYLQDLDSSASRTYVQSEAAGFGHMALVEVSRGCSRGCRFCAAGFVYLPPRERSLDNLLQQVDEGLCQRNRIGLVAAAIADYSQVLPLQQGIVDRGGEISVSSLRLDAIDAKAVALLNEAGHASVAIAPEAGSQRLRDVINKGLSEEQILAAVQLLTDGGIKHLKLYFLIGLPFELMTDVEAIIALVQRIVAIRLASGKARGHMGNLTVSVNPFIPKPFTPFQWAGMEGEKSLKKKGRMLQSAFSRIPNTRFMMESVRLATLQAFLSRGDRRIAAMLPELATGGNLRQLCAAAKFPLLDELTRERGQDEAFAWEIIDSGVRREYLWREYQRAAGQHLTPPCAPGCCRCGVCS
ncbi:MAG: radical SAM protein [Desulfuromonadales bacterium]|nr:radical SAM protein [Desulfuromonadales bacterium]